MLRSVRAARWARSCALGLGCYSARRTRIACARTARKGARGAPGCLEGRVWGRQRRGAAGRDGDHVRRVEGQEWQDGAGTETPLAGPRWSCRRGLVAWGISYVVGRNCSGEHVHGIMRWCATLGACVQQGHWDGQVLPHTREGDPWEGRRCGPWHAGPARARCTGDDDLFL